MENNIETFFQENPQFNQLEKELIQNNTNLIQMFREFFNIEDNYKYNPNSNSFILNEIHFEEEDLSDLFETINKLVTDFGEENYPEESIEAYDNIFFLIYNPIERLIIPSIDRLNNQDEESYDESDNEESDNEEPDIEQQRLNRLREENPRQEGETNLQYQIRIAELAEAEDENEKPMGYGECPICMKALTNKETVVDAHPEDNNYSGSTHKFHKDCLLEICNDMSQVPCPLCRRKINCDSIKKAGTGAEGTGEVIMNRLQGGKRKHSRSKSKRSKKGKKLITKKRKGKKKYTNKKIKGGKRRATKRRKY